MIYLASDHRGFKLKEELKDFFQKQNLEVQDLGAFSYDQNDDYADFAALVAEKISEKPSLDKGILICGSGHGMDIVANKFKGVRAVLVFNRQVAAQSREHEDANILVLAADWLEPADAVDIITVWLGKSFSGEDRHVRRLKKIGEVEEKNFKL